MKQELSIKGEVVSYTLLTKNITAVLGKAYIYKVPTPEEFVSGFNSGTVWMSKKKGQYTLWMIYGLLRGRINEINKEYKP